MDGYHRQRFEREGTCSYGNRCTYAHGIAELRQRPVTGSNFTLFDSMLSVLLHVAVFRVDRRTQSSSNESSIQDQAL